MHSGTFFSTCPHTDTQTLGLIELRLHSKKAVIVKVAKNDPLDLTHPAKKIDQVDIKIQDMG